MPPACDESGDEAPGEEEKTPANRFSLCFMLEHAFPECFWNTAACASLGKQLKSLDENTAEFEALTREFACIPSVKDACEEYHKWVRGVWSHRGDGGD